MQSHYSPGYAYPTQHPYAQYTGEVTYPGPSIMAVSGFAEALKEWQTYLVALPVALVAMLAVYMYIEAGKKKKPAVKYGLPALTGLAAFFGAAYLRSVV